MNAQSEITTDRNAIMKRVDSARVALRDATIDYLVSVKSGAHAKHGRCPHKFRHMDWGSFISGAVASSVGIGIACAVFLAHTVTR